MRAKRKIVVQDLYGRDAVEKFAAERDSDESGLSNRYRG